MAGRLNIPRELSGGEGEGKRPGGGREGERERAYLEGTTSHESNIFRPVQEGWPLCRGENVGRILGVVSDIIVENDGRVRSKG